MKKKFLLLLISALIITTAFSQIKNNGKRNVLFISAHPDDWEEGVGGSALLMKDSFNIYICSVTRGERGLSKEPSAETAAIREKEERNAAAMVNAEVFFLGCIDGDVYADKKSVDSLVKILKILNPVAVFTQWAVDIPDHAATYGMTLKALFVANMIWDRDVYFWEADHGGQSNQFIPDLYVNVSRVHAEKVKMIRMHVCQNPNDEIGQLIINQDKWRGLIARCDFAESFKTYLPIASQRWAYDLDYILLKLK